MGGVLRTRLSQAHRPLRQPPQDKHTHPPREELQLQMLFSDVSRQPAALFKLGPGCANGQGDKGTDTSRKEPNPRRDLLCDNGRFHSGQKTGVSINEDWGKLDNYLEKKKK